MLAHSMRFHIFIPSMKYISAVLIISILLPFNITAETPVLDQKTLNFESLTINDGLSQGMINCIIQDRFGFMWFATRDGLNRYDGHRFVVYQHNPSDSTSLIDNFIQTIFEDSKGRLWIGTGSKGIELFDREKDNFIHLSELQKETSSHPDGFILNITEDKNGLIWISSMTDLTTLRVNENEPAREKRYVFKSISPHRFSLFVAKDGSHYFSGNEKVYKTGLKSESLSPADTVLRNHIYQSDAGDADSLQHFFEDTTGHYLYYFFQKRITRENLITKTIETVSAGKYNRGIYSSKIFLDDAGKIWMCELEWLMVLDPDSKQMTRVTAFDSDLDKFLNNVSTIYRDRSGIIWIGTKGYGILKHNPATEKFNRTGNSTILFISGTTDGKILLSRAGRYAEVFDPVKGTFIGTIPSQKHFPVPESNPGGVLDAVIEEKPGIFWFCKERVCRYDSINKTMKEYRKGKGVNFPVYKSRKNEIWCGGLNALCRYDSRTDDFTEYPYPITASENPYRFVESVYDDAHGVLWLGTTAGLLRFDPADLSWRQYKNIPGDSLSLSWNIIFSVCPDPLQPETYLWIGTNGGGLNRFEYKTGKFKRYIEKDGLPSNVVYGIVSDASGSLWLSTNKGLAEFDRDKKFTRKFEQSDGLQGNEFNRYAYCRLNNGMICFGGVDGFNYFFPQVITYNHAVPQIQITDIKITNQSVPLKQQGGLLEKPSYMTKEIVLQYRDNMLSFEFASLDFSTPSKNLYQYKLDGFDKKWIQAGTNYTATYTNLDPGRYLFKVLGSNNDEIWNNQGAFIRIVILPPWYMTFWFRITAVVLVVAGIYWSYRYRVRQALKLQVVRDRIARDLHDEIGSTLQSISMYSVVAGNVVAEKAPEAKEMLSQISESTSMMMEALSDIVWTINTRNDRFDNMVNRMRAFAVEALEPRNCKVHFSTTANLASYNLGMEQRKNLFLIFKESINNAARHGECKNVWVDCSIRHNKLFMRITDDGKGFAGISRNGTSKAAGGNGLINIRQRAGELKGKLHIQSEEGKGTVVELEFQL
jgi:ligand-binding sensor domain-containing protein/two-component sensor histidine kinase